MPSRHKKNFPRQQTCRVALADGTHPIYVCHVPRSRALALSLFPPSPKKFRPRFAPLSAHRAGSHSAALFFSGPVLHVDARSLGPRNHGPLRRRTRRYHRKKNSSLSSLSLSLSLSLGTHIHRPLVMQVDGDPKKKTVQAPTSVKNSRGETQKKTQSRERGAAKNSTDLCGSRDAPFFLFFFLGRGV
jgi:sRNA-binding carbon storage regulator CsrA